MDDDDDATLYNSNERWYRKMFRASTGRVLPVIFELQLETLAFLFVFGSFYGKCLPPDSLSIYQSSAITCHPSPVIFTRTPRRICPLLVIQISNASSPQLTWNMTNTVSIVEAHPSLTRKGLKLFTFKHRRRVIKSYPLSLFYVLASQFSSPDDTVLRATSWAGPRESEKRELYKLWTLRIKPGKFAVKSVTQTIPETFVQFEHKHDPGIRGCCQIISLIGYAIVDQYALRLLKPFAEPGVTRITMDIRRW
ncbi:hypothetical protein FB446DRAFT_704540 [Lentinula raphanica]|nr:hypothetical protein FB446DRAFT_704540 [Lentinula raphanica]